MKKWLLEHYLPLWAKQTVALENQRLLEENRALKEDVHRLEQYIRGVHDVLAYWKRARKERENGNVSVR